MCALKNLSLCFIVNIGDIYFANDNETPISMWQLRRALNEAEQQLEERQMSANPELQHWLQMTYEIETKYFELKREATEKQLMAAKEMVGRLKLCLYKEYE